MPAIKKKWMKASHDDGSSIDADKERKDDSSKPDQGKDPDAILSDNPVPKPVKRNMPQGPSMLRRLDGEVLQEKRKRFIPPAELKLSEWLDSNFEKRTDKTIKLTLLYKHYTELCQMAGSDILGVPEFNRMVKEKFGKTFGLQEGSAYKGVIKEHKLSDKKTGGTGIKLKDIAIEAINHFGNPWHGIRVFVLRKYISSRYPALQLDNKPKLLRRTLQVGLNCGYVELVKGIGMAGYYRLPGGEPPPEFRELVKKSESTDDENKPPEEEQDKKDSETLKKEGAEQIKKKKIIKKYPAWNPSKVNISNPRLVEDTFPLALTYQSAPKTASIQRIRRYILEKYQEQVSDHRWRQAVENGVKKGYWEQISGSGIAGTLHLQMDDFDPESNQIEDMICAAIIACHEPKAASANQIKKYVSTYHTEFAIDQRPERFKKALQRAVEKKMLTQLTGLGAAGTYQLVLPFTPTPAMLAGDDDDEDDDNDDEPSSYVPRGTKSRGMPKVKTMEVIRSAPKKARSGPVKQAPATSRKGKAKKSVVVSGKGKPKKPQKQKSQSRNRVKNGRKRELSPLTDEEEEDEEDEKVEYTPSKTKSRQKPAPSLNNKGKDKSKPTGSSSQNKKKKDSGRSAEKRSTPAKKRRLSEDVSSGEELDDTPEYTPRKSKSRGGGNEVKSPSKAGRNKRKR